MAVKELIAERIIDAPQSLVFKMWVDARHLVKWWAPKGFTNPECELDPRPGGRFYVLMVAADGTRYPTIGKFVEVSEPCRLVFTVHSHLDQHGTAAIKITNTVIFEDINGTATKLTLHACVTEATGDAAFALQGMNTGWNQSLDKLVEYAEVEIE